MTMINGLPPLAPIGHAGRRPGAAGPGGFTVPDGERAEAASGGVAAGGVSLAGLLALQEGEAEDVRDRAARRHGRDILAELDALRHALLKDGVEPNQLRRLAALAGDMPEAADPRLRGVMREIGLRAAVELARCGVD